MKIVKQQDRLTKVVRTDKILNIHIGIFFSLTVINLAAQVWKTMSKKKASSCDYFL